MTAADGHPKNPGSRWDRFHPDVPKERVKYLYEIGFTLEQVAELTGCPEGSIRDVLLLQGVVMRPKSCGSMGSRLPHGEFSKPAFMYEQMEMSTVDIAVVMGISESTVRYRLRVHGVKIRGKSEAIRRGYAKMTPERRSEMSRKAYATRRRNLMTRLARTLAAIAEAPAEGLEPPSSDQQSEVLPLDDAGEERRAA